MTEKALVESTNSCILTIKGRLSSSKFAPIEAGDANCDGKINVGDAV
jgi:hypothetical protein